MSIDVRCHTNLDLHPCEEWPSELTCRPVVGDIIESSTGLELQVVRVAHSPHSKTGFYPSGSYYTYRQWSLVLVDVLVAMIIVGAHGLQIFDLPVLMCIILSTNYFQRNVQRYSNIAWAGSSFIQEL